MPIPSASIVDAVSGAEICPLCFDRYSAADQCACVICGAASCPSCAELIDRSGAQRCFACRPVQASAPVALAQASQPLSLPRPILVPAAARARAEAPVRAGLPPLPFPLTTSPYGVRVLSPEPPGSVFVGLPPLSPALTASLQRAPASPLHLSRRARVQLARFMRLLSALATSAALLTRLMRALRAAAPVQARALRRLAQRVRALGVTRPDPSRPIRL